MEGNTSILTGDINTLKEFRQIVTDYADSRAICAQAESEENRLAKELELNRKNLKETVDITVRKRRDEVASTFDDEIAKDQDKIRKIKNQREKAKEKGIKGRIENETAELVTQNSELRNNVRSTLKAEKLPAVCGTYLYMTLYMTKGVMEGFLCGLIIIVMFLLLPGGVYLALPIEKLDEKYHVTMCAIVYFVVILIVFGIYKLIGNLTKRRHKEVLISVRNCKTQIAGNNRKIKKIAKAIRHDKNEEQYGLDDYDAQINEIEKDIELINKNKLEAIEKYNDITSKEIVKEIENRELARINEIEASYTEMSKRHAELEDKVKQLGLKISTEYEAYIGKEFSNPDKIDALIEIIETGKAVTVSEAVNVYKLQ